ncbi:MAG: CoA activase, partial [Deltaproteobacteria bacterium]|nr:CoA activase [Deltaproteobacteria bacterium]
GFSDVPIFAPDQDEKFYEELGGAVSSEFPKLGWWGITAIDLLEKKLREVRPYEKNAGDTEKVYWKSVTSVCDAIRDKRFPDKELLGAKEAFNSIDANEYGTLPVVGLVGEIYVRCNRFSNDDLVKNLEANGAEVRLPPFAEWIYYTNFVSKRKNWNKSSYSNFFKTFVNDFFQHKFEKKLGNVFNGDLRSGHEPRIKEILELASPYIHDSFEGEATLSVGKVIDYINGGAHGIVNVMPFTCMPGTIVNGVLKKVKEDNDNIPYLNMVYEGIEDTNAKTRIEAFVHQAKDYKSRRPNKKVVGA